MRDRKRQRFPHQRQQFIRWRLSTITDEYFVDDFERHLFYRIYINLVSKRTVRLRMYVKLNRPSPLYSEIGPLRPSRDTFISVLPLSMSSPWASVSLSVHLPQPHFLFICLSLIVWSSAPASLSLHLSQNHCLFICPASCPFI